MKQLDLFKQNTPYQIINDDCLNAMKSMNDNSIDFIVTDPPYGLNFMNKKWDSAVPNIEIWSEALRICKPGSMLAAFGGSRTHHHLMIALEQGGWEIRDVIMWLYGSGFPKSYNKFGLEGYGTALKPAYEPIIICQKPLDGTYKQNVEKWGIGGINIDECRIETNERLSIGSLNPGYEGGYKGGFNNLQSPKGRWPANIIFDAEAAQLLDEQTGILKSGSGDKHSKTQDKSYSGGFKPLRGIQEYKADSGGASRFFYCAKASNKERNEGLKEMPLKEADIKNDSRRGFSETNPNKPILKQNNHPTVKPIALMEYIIKLLAPSNNPILLDPFMGSGSTLLAAQNLGITSIGIEREQEYCEIALNRLKNS